MSVSDRLCNEKIDMLTRRVKELKRELAAEKRVTAYFHKVLTKYYHESAVQMEIWEKEARG